MKVTNCIAVVLSLLLVYAVNASDVDDMGVKLRTLYRGYDNISDMDFSSWAPAREQIEVEFTALASQPEEFSWDLLNTVQFYQPVDPTTAVVVSSYDCTSNGITVTMKDTEDKDSTTPTNHGLPTDAYPTTFTVKKNGITADTLVTCAFYYTKYEKYSSTGYVYSKYDGNSADVVFTPYTVSDIVFLDTEDSDTKPYITATVYYQLPSAQAGNTTITQGSTFSILFTAPITFPANAETLVLADSGTTYCTCTTANNMLYTCTWVLVPSNPDDFSLAFDFAPSAYNPTASLMEMVFEMPDGMSYYGIIYEIKASPIFGVALSNIATNVDVTFGVPKPDDASTHYVTMAMDPLASDTIEFGSSCTNADGTVYATVAKTSPTIYKFTYTSAAISQLDASAGVYTFTCGLYIITSARSQYTFASVTVPGSGNIYTYYSITANNPARLTTIALRTGYEMNHISFYGNGYQIDANTVVSITGVSFPSGMTSAVMGCSSSTNSNTFSRTDVSVTIDGTSMTATLPSTPKMYGCVLQLPSDAVMTTVTLYSNGNMINSMDFVETPVKTPELKITMDASAQLSAAVFTIPQLPADLLNTTSVTMQLTGINLGAGLSVSCPYQGPTSQVTTQCSQTSFDTMTCNVNSGVFKGLGYADLLCTMSSNYVQGTTVEDTVLTINGLTTDPIVFDFGTLSTTRGDPVVDLLFVEQYLAIGDTATMHVNLYGIYMSTGDSLTLTFKNNDTDADIEFFEAGTTATVSNAVTLTTTATTATITCTAAHARPVFYNIVVPNVPVKVSGANIKAVTTSNMDASGDNAGRVFVNNIVIPSYGMKYDDVLSVTPSTSAPTVAVSYETTNRQTQSLKVVAGSYEGNAIITGVSNVVGGTITESNGVYTMSISTATLAIGESKKVTFDLTYVNNFACDETEGCIGAPSVTLAPALQIPTTTTLSTLSAGDFEFIVAKTYGAFTSATAGLVVKFSFVPDALVIENILGLTDENIEIYVYSVSETAVSENAIGYFSVLSSNNTKLIPMINDTSALSAVNGLTSSVGYWAVAMFESTILPTIPAVDTALTIGTKTETINLAFTPVYEVTITAPTTIRESTSFLIDFTFNSTGLDALSTKVDFSGIPATLEHCSDADDVDVNAVDVEMVATFPVATSMATVTTMPSPLASYAFKCNFTALDYDTAKATTYANAVKVHVLYNDAIVKTAEQATPTLTRDPVTMVKLVNTFDADALLSSSDINRILAVMTISMQSIVSSFTVNQFRQMSQKYTPNAPLMASLPTLPASDADVPLAVDMVVLANGKVALTTYIKDVTVSDVSNAKSIMNSGFTALGVSVTLGDPEESTVEAICGDTCGGDCGMCRDGAACTADSDCFSGKCTDGVCKSSNSAKSVSTALAVVVALVAAAMLI